MSSFLLGKTEQSDTRFCKSHSTFIIYQYIPPISAHSGHVFPALVLNEFKRYRLVCTSDADYEEQVSRFYARLMNRGYTSDMIHEARVQVLADTS